MESSDDEPIAKRRKPPEHHVARYAEIADQKNQHGEPDFPQVGTNEGPDQEEYQRQRQKEQGATNTFLDGLRRAVHKNIAERQRQDPTPPLENFAYNNTTRELRRLHGHQEDSMAAQSNRIHNTEDHMQRYLEQNVVLYEHELLRKQRNQTRIGKD